MLFGIFKRKKKFIVSIPRKGGSLILGKIEARNLEDALSTIPDMLEEVKDNPAVKRAKYIHLIESDTGVKHKTKNPFYDPEFAKQYRAGEVKKNVNLPDPETVKASMYLDILDDVSKSLGKLIPQMMNTVMNASVDIVKESVRNIVLKEKETQTSQLKDIAEFVKAIVLLAKHKDEVKALIRENKEELMKMIGGSGGEKA